LFFGTESIDVSIGPKEQFGHALEFFESFIHILQDNVSHYLHIVPGSRTIPLQIKQHIFCSQSEEI